MIENDNTQVEEEPVVYGFDNDSDYAANCCGNYRFKHGDIGFLPAVGQLLVMHRLKSSINSALSLIGGTQLNTLLHSYWSSSQYDSTYAWSMFMGGGAITFGYNTKNSNDYVRAICSIS